MKRTSNLRIRGLTPIIAPNDLKQVFPLSERGAEFVTPSREQITDILHQSRSALDGRGRPLLDPRPQSRPRLCRASGELARETVGRSCCWSCGSILKNRAPPSAGKG